MTIPLSIRQKISLNEGDMLEAIERDGLIILIPKALTNKLSQAKNKPSLMSLIGANEGSGLYESTKDIDQTIRGH